MSKRFGAGVPQSRERLWLDAIPDPTAAGIRWREVGKILTRDASARRKFAAVTAIGMELLKHSFTGRETPATPDSEPSND